MDSIVHITIVALIILASIFRENIIAIVKHICWKNKIKNIHEYNDIQVPNCLRNSSKNGFEYFGDEIPYGRTRWFLIENEKYLSIQNVEEIEFYGYSPIRSRTEIEFSEVIDQGITYYNYEVNYLV